MCLTIPATPLNDAHLGGLFIYMTQEYLKPSLTLGEQISFLKKQGLIVTDELKAHHILKIVGYYRS